MKRQLTPIPSHIRIEYCPPGIAEGSINEREWRRPAQQGLMLNAGCTRKRLRTTNDESLRPY